MTQINLSINHSEKKATKELRSVIITSLSYGQEGEEEIAKTHAATNTFKDISLMLKNSK